MMTLDLAHRIISKTLAAAAQAQSKPLTVAVVDLGGVPIALARQDGAGVSRPTLSFAKAEACLALHMPTRTLASFHATQPDMHALLRATTGKALVPLAGGVLVKDQQGRVIGAVGVSGGTLDEEENMVIQAILDCDLVPDPRELNAPK